MLQPVVYQFMYHVIICHSLLFTRSGTTLEWCVNAVMVQPVVYGVKDHIRVVLSQPVQVRNHVKVVNVHQARDHVAVVVYQNHYVRAICLPGQEPRKGGTHYNHHVASTCFTRSKATW